MRPPPRPSRGHGKPNEPQYATRPPECDSTTPLPGNFLTRYSRAGRDGTVLLIITSTRPSRPRPFRYWTSTTRRSSLWPRLDGGYGGWNDRGSPNRVVADLTSESHPPRKPPPVAKDDPGGGGCCLLMARPGGLSMRRLSWEDCASARKGGGREEWRRVTVCLDDGLEAALDLLLDRRLLL